MACAKLRRKKGIDAIAPRILLLTLAAMIAFAANSLFCRVALRQTTIDPASFTFIRIFSGAVALWLIMKSRKAEWADGGNWLSALSLFAYAAAFSFAYVSLSAGTGALLLFGAVQVTMIVWGLLHRERLRLRQLLGLGLALSGFVALLWPGLSAPPFGGSVLMLGAGLAWGIYSLRGKAAIHPANETAGNFIRAAPFAAVLSMALFPWARFDQAGIGYAILSGAVTSGLGYVLWYAALPGLKTASAATVQLAVPVLAAVGGILLLGEPLTLRLLFASIVVLGGIALVVIGPSRQDADSGGARLATR